MNIEDEHNIIKHKGPAKKLVSSEWFRKTLAAVSPVSPMKTSTKDEAITAAANFRLDWKKLEIGRKEIRMKLGIPLTTKRKNVYDDNNIWIDTRPINVIDLGSKDANTIVKSEI